MVVGLLILPATGFAQQKADDQPQGKKTITIHVTKEVDGNIMVIDTTVVTDGEFDADAFLERKGILKDIPESDGNMEKNIIIRRPRQEDFTWSDSDPEVPDTIINNDDTIIVFSDRFDMPGSSLHQNGINNQFDFDIPDDFSPMQQPQFEDRMEAMLRSFGLENVMPFGEMKQVVVKKKRNGKKVIITFEDRKNKDGEKEHEQGNRKKKEKVIIFRNGDQGSIPQNDERVMIKGKPGENVVIHKTVKKIENGDQVIINEEVENPTSVKKDARVIIIKKDGTK
jgi:hypothetical protein